MQVADALEEIQIRNARIECGKRGIGQEAAIFDIHSQAEEERLLAEQEDEEAARWAFSKAEMSAPRLNPEPYLRRGGPPQPEAGEDIYTSPPAIDHTFERTKNVKKTAMTVLVKKREPSKPPPATLGLGGYGLDWD